MAKGKKLKLTEIETERVEGALAKLRLAALAHQQAQAKSNEVIATVAGPGYVLEQKEDGIYRKKPEKKE